MLKKKRDLSMMDEKSKKKYKRNLDIISMCITVILFISVASVVISFVR